MEIDHGAPAVASSEIEVAAPPPVVWAVLTSTIQEVDAPRSIAWTGKTMGIDAVHVWRFEPTAGGTRVQTEESWAGWLPRLLRGRLQEILQKSLDDGLPPLKAEAERRTDGAQ